MLKWLQHKQYQWTTPLICHGVNFYKHRIDKRSKYSRRREFQHDADVDYINEHNMKFNHKRARFYDKYTAEIKHNLERGTAI